MFINQNSLISKPKTRPEGLAAFSVYWNQFNDVKQIFAKYGSGNDLVNWFPVVNLQSLSSRNLQLP